MLALLLVSINSIKEYSDAHLLILKDEESTIDGIELIEEPIFGVSYKEGVVIIIEEGTYIVSGELNGKLHITTGDKVVKIVLNGVNINSSINALVFEDGYELINTVIDKDPFIIRNYNFNEAGAQIIIADDSIEKQNEEDNKNKKEEEYILNKELKTMNKNRNIKKVIKTFRFWRLAFVQLFLTFAFSFILGTGRTFGALIGIDGNVLQFLTLSQSGALILVGPILGILVDKKGPLNLLRITTLVCMIPGILLTFFVRNTIIFISSFIIAALALTSTIVTFAPFIMEIYGIQEREG